MTPAASITPRDDGERMGRSGVLELPLIRRAAPLGMFENRTRSRPKRKRVLPFGGSGDGAEL
jgi:hypothetical protein